MKVGDRVKEGKNGKLHGTVIKHPRDKLSPPVWVVRVRWDDGEIKTYRYGDGEIWYVERAALADDATPKEICKKAERILAGMVDPRQYVLDYDSKSGPFTGARYFWAGSYLARHDDGGQSGPFLVPGSDNQEPTAADVELAQRIIADAEAASSADRDEEQMRAAARNGMLAAFRGRRGVPDRIGHFRWLGLEGEVARNMRNMPGRITVEWKGQTLHVSSDPKKVLDFLREANIELRKEISIALEAFHGFSGASDAQCDFLDKMDEFIKVELGLDKESEKGF